MKQEVPILERLPPRSWWQRAYSYIKSMVLPFSYYPEKILSKEMIGKWEVVNCKPGNLGFYYDLKEKFSKKMKEPMQKLLGTKFIIHPNYIVIDGVQYSQPLYRKLNGYEDEFKILIKPNVSERTFTIPNNDSLLCEFGIDKNGVLKGECFKYFFR